MSKQSKSRTPEEVRSPNSRNTHDWCKGKNGRQHDYVWVEARWAKAHNKSGLVWTEELTCQLCGKISDYRRSSYTFGFLVKTFREARGWTQNELAEKLGVPQSRVAYIEADSSIPNLRTIAKVAHALKAEYRLSFGGMPIGVDGYQEPPDWERAEGWDCLSGFTTERTT